ncbi:MAG: hypothetical protein A2075_11735 [Geobacteraceae bacterium GWC2_58_44]|nr:MAG: hypothetical protein A2075_11735 [Geobacteraceae bacterium GWC2_58_44]HBG08285.1 hypothetical protein [Geobacter sp.]
MQTVAVLYQDENDRKLWEAPLKGIPGLLSITVGGNLTASLEALRAIASTLRVVILSARLYPEENPELAARVRAVSSGSELLLISSSREPSPPLLPLFADNVRHLAIDGPEGDRPVTGYLPAVVSMLVDRIPWEIGSCLRAGTPIHSFPLGSSEEKESLIGALEAALSGEGEEYEMLRQKGALLADELLENALNGAPRGTDGSKLFKKGAKRTMLPQERIVFSFGFDGETLALKLTDSWGTLEPELVMEYLARNQEEGTCADDAGGRGLFIIWRFLEQFHVNIHPGQETVVGGHLQLSSRLDLETPRGFHITAHQKEMQHEYPANRKF